MEFIEQDLIISMDKPYLRPFICNGDYKTAQVMLVGINPASPIYPKDIGFTEYTHLCKDYKSFMTFYKDIRNNSGKSELSRTRIGILSFVEWIKTHMNMDVIETDIFTYPTSSVNELKQIPKTDLFKSQDLFWKMFMELTKCEIVILYGSLTVQSFIHLMIEKKIDLELINKLSNGKGHITDLLKYPIEYLENNSPIFTIRKAEKKMSTFAIRHLMYYGKIGESYYHLKNSILNCKHEISLT